MSLSRLVAAMVCAGVFATPTLAVEERLIRSLPTDTPTASPSGDVVAFTDVTPPSQGHYPIPRVYGQFVAGGPFAVRTPRSVTSNPSWSPTGTHLAMIVPEYVSDSEPAERGIWITPIGGDPFQVVGESGVHDVAWAPTTGDMDKVAYLVNGTMKQVSFDISGQGVAPPTAIDIPGGWIESLAWGASGDIAFSQGGDLWILDASFGMPRQLTSGPASDVEPAWSPDGNWIAFSSDRSGNRDVWLIAAQGGEARQLTSETVHEGNPSWSGGTAIVFTRIVTFGGFDSHAQLWLMTDVPLDPMPIEARSWSDVKALYRE